MELYCYLCNRKKIKLEILRKDKLVKLKRKNRGNSKLIGLLIN
jgi:hypothetical protein